MTPRITGALTTERCCPVRRAATVTQVDFQMFEAVGALVVVLDIDDRIIYWNQLCSEVTGYSIEEVRDRRFWEFLLVSEEVEPVKSSLATLRTAQHPSRFANYWITKTGERRWIAWSNTVTAGPDGRPRYLIKTGIDRTEENRRDRERGLLAELGAALADTLDYDDTLTRVARLVVRDLADFCIVDLIDTGGTLRPMKVLHRDPSKATLCEMFQRLPFETGQARLVSSVVESKQPRLMAEVSSQDFASVAQDDEHRRALRELDPRSLMAVPLSARGEVLGAIVLVSSDPSRRYGEEDLLLAEEVANRAALAIENARLYRDARAATHDLREANQQMVKATILAHEQTDEAEAAKARLAESERELREIAEFRERFIGILGHDLRNPMASISMTAALLLRGGHLDEQAEQQVARIVSSSERMRRMISQMLDLTRARLGGGFPLEPKPTDLLGVCRTVVEEFEAPIRLEVEGDVTGRWDPDRLAEALSNVAGNAIEHAAPGTAVVIKARANGPEVVVEIINRGDPIPGEVLPFIFEPFRRAKQQKKLSGNLGLGLYIAKQIVEAGRGTLAAFSADGTTTFVMRLPRHAPPAETPSSRVEVRT
jgi:PAS domain S-box-containing protein